MTDTSLMSRLKQKGIMKNTCAEPADHSMQSQEREQKVKKVKLSQEKFKMTQHGLLIDKRINKESTIERIREELTVKPQEIFDDQQSRSFTVFTEDKKYLYIPRFYAQNHLKISPSQIKIKDQDHYEKIDIQFKLPLRDNQKEIMPVIINKINQEGGAILNLDCAVGKCLGQGTYVKMFNNYIQDVSQIRVGNTLIGDDLMPRKVTSITCGQDIMYTVSELKNGIRTLFECNSSHILTLYDEQTDKIFDAPIDQLEQGKVYMGVRLIMEQNEEQGKKSSVTFNKVLNHLLKDHVNKVNMSIDLTDTSLRDTHKFHYEKFKMIIKSTHLGTYYGFTLDNRSSSRRFLLSNDVITHNTVISLNVAQQLGYKTLVVVDKLFILEQWIKEINKFTTASIGRLQGKQKDLDGDIVVSTLQSISKEGKYDPKIFQPFGTVIFDEGHHIASETFSNAPKMLQKKYIMNLSATHERKDQLTKVVEWFSNKPVFEVQNEQGAIEQHVQVQIINFFLEKQKKNLQKLFQTYKSRMKINGNHVTDTVKMVSNVCQIDLRNELIVSLIKELKGRNVLVLSDRVNHLTQLRNMTIEQEGIDVPEEKISLFIASTKPNERELMTEQSQIIFATYKIASEAMSIPRLNALILATPKGDIKQACGRIKRKYDPLNKPIIIDINDQLEGFQSSHQRRLKFYQDKGNKISMRTYVNNKFID